jgi:hypothetical protein
MEIVGFISISILIIIQIATFAFYFGKLNGKVDSIDKRLNDLSHRFDRIEERVHQLEVKK